MSAPQVTPLPPAQQTPQPTPVGVPAVTPDTVKSADWGTVVEQSKQEGNRQWTFLGTGTNRMKLLVPPGQMIEEFFVHVDNYYQGSKGHRWMVFAMISRIGGKTREDMDFGPNQVVPVILPTKVKNSIINNLKEGWDLLSPAGHPISITKAGSGIGTTYNVAVGPEALVIDPALLEWPEKDILTLATEYSADSLDRNGTATGETKPVVKEQGDVDKDATAGW